MMAIINERQLTPSQEEELDLQQTAPQKFDPEFEFKVNKKASNKKLIQGPYRTYTPEETAALIAATNAPFTPPPKQEERLDYPTYTREQVQELMRQHYEYIANEEKLKEERSKWDSTKTIVSELKTKNTKKRSTSTKA